jgi:hypothetical protein
MFRVRTNFFFVFVFPMVLILVLGATFGGSSSPRLGVVSTGSGPSAPRCCVSSSRPRSCAWWPCPAQRRC